MSDRNTPAYPARGRGGSLFILMTVAVVLHGCSSAPDSVGLSSPPPNGSAPAPDLGSGRQAPATYIDARPAALVNGRSVTWGDLRPALTEAAGVRVLEEHILNQVVGEAAREAGLTITDQDIAAERLLMVQSLHEDQDKALRLLDDLRQRDGLGPSRFGALLRRNAALRAMVRDDVTVSEEAIRRLHEIRHGPKRQARLIIVPDLSAALRVRERAAAGERFADIAVEVSTDASAARGGLLEPISRFDPAYPESLRKALWSLESGGISTPILMGDRYAILMLVMEMQGDNVWMEDVRDELAELVRLDQERLLMDQLARRLVGNVTITIFDETLDSQWKRRNPGIR